MGMGRQNVLKDLSLLRKKMGGPCTIAQEAIYLELGVLNIGAVIKARRLTYLHYLVKRNPSEMIYKFFITQWNHERISIGFRLYKIQI